MLCYIDLATIGARVLELLNSNEGVQTKVFKRRKVIFMTALTRAAMLGHTGTLNALAGTHNANVEAVDEDGWTALMLAAYDGHTDTVDALRRYGASHASNACDESNETKYPRGLHRLT